MTQSENRELFGLVLGGGKSERMGQDKGLLVYHSQPQVSHCFSLLEIFCGRVFVSLRKEQTVLPAYQGLPNILDDSKEDGAGPLRGILSALRRHPQRSWLVLACDLPFVDRSVLQELVIRRNPQRMATAFYNPQTDSPEPMCAIYEPSILPLIEQSLGQGIFCPRKVLKGFEAEVLSYDRPGVLCNINTPQEYDHARRQIQLKNAKL